VPPKLFGGSSITSTSHEHQVDLALPPMATAPLGRGVKRQSSGLTWPTPIADAKSSRDPNCGVVGTGGNPSCLAPPPDSRRFILGNEQ
jgi:hypothetical protein